MKISPLIPRLILLIAVVIFSTLLLLEPSKQVSKHVFDGQVKHSYPRILFPELSDARETNSTLHSIIRTRFNTYKVKGIKNPPLPCTNDTRITALVSCWAATNDDEKARLATETLLNTAIQPPNAETNYGSAWVLALAYDLLSASKFISAQDRHKIEQKLTKALEEYLQVLDRKSASLWHGRLTLASNAWLCAIVLNPETAKQKQLIARAQAHFIESMQAVAITEAWPEGYNYWINNRAFTFILASAAYINGLENSTLTESVKALVNRIGLWTIYATRPDNRIEGYGDEGPRIDLKDETQRVIDLIAGLTQNSIFATYSNYISRLHRQEGYYRSYRWGFHLFNDPTLLNYSRPNTLSDFEGKLPASKLFGKDGTNKLYIRSSWQPDATFISYSAGHRFSHHGHYDSGHFTIFKKTPLAANSSIYENFSGSNRLSYSIRTIAKNSLIIQKKGEKVKPNRFFEKNVSDGGQRIVLPTGSAIVSTSHWRENLNSKQHLEAAELQSYELNDEFVYLKSDLTPAYNNTNHDKNGSHGKVKKVSRELFYLRHNDILLIKDNIKTLNTKDRVKWLLHSINKPKMKQERILIGKPENGIFESFANEITIENQPGTLKAKVLWPKESLTRLIGGPDYRFYIETDGDDSTLDGQNFNGTSSDKLWFDNPYWRTEIMPKLQTKSTDFLVALSPGVKTLSTTQIERLKGSSTNELAIMVDNSAIVFNKTTSQELQLNLPNNTDHLYLVGYNRRPKGVHINQDRILNNERIGNVLIFSLEKTEANKVVKIHF